jgi:hypothetical protein
VIKVIACAVGAFVHRRKARVAVAYHQLGLVVLNSYLMSSTTKALLTNSRTRDGACATGSYPSQSSVLQALCALERQQARVGTAAGPNR